MARAFLYRSRLAIARDLEYAARVEICFVHVFCARVYTKGNNPDKTLGPRTITLWAGVDAAPPKLKSG